MMRKIRTSDVSGQPFHFSRANQRVQYAFKLSSVLLSPILGLVVFWTLLYFLTPPHPSPAESLIAATFAGIVGLLIPLLHLARIRVIGRNLVAIALIVYLARVGIGVWHYVYFLDPSYFASSETILDYKWDYVYLGHSANKISDYWNSYGFGLLPPEFFKNKNTYLMPYFALVFYLGDNNHLLNISALNALHASMVAIMVIRFAFIIKGIAMARGVFLIAMLQPFGFISSIQWRDSVGQFFLITGAMIIILTPARLSGAPTAIFGAFSMMLLRNIYFMHAILLVGVKLLTSRTSSANTILSVLPLVIGLTIFGFGALFERVFVYQTSSQAFSFNKDVASLGYDLIRGLAGPFPWTQMLDSNTSGREYQIQDVFQAAFNLAIIYSIWLTWLRGEINMRVQHISVAITFVFSMMLTGLISYGHVSYVTVASVLALPLISPFYIGRFFRIFSFILMGLILTGGLWDVFYAPLSR